MVLTSDWLWASIALGTYILVTTVQLLLIRYTRLPAVGASSFNYLIGGVVAFLIPYFFTQRFPVILVGLAIAFFNFAGLRWFRSKDIDAPRRGLGPVYLPLVAVLLIYFYFDSNPAVYQSVIFAFAIADPMATIVGQSLGKKRSWFRLNDAKTPEGFVVMAIVIYLAFLVCGFTGLFPGLTYFDLIPVITLIALVAALAEVILTHGLDNIFVPLGMAFLTDNLLSEPTLAMWLWLVLVIMIVFGILASYLKLLTPDGSVAMIIMGLFLFGLGGWAWVLPLLAFFLLSSLLGFLRKNRSEGEIHVKSGPRDQFQVWANGGVPLLLFFLATYNLWPWIYVIYLVSVAAAMADTWSTESGRLFSRTRPVDILSRQPVPRGQSGGVTIAGLLGGLAGSMIIAAFIFIQTDYFFETPWKVATLIVLAGFSGTLIDSILGSRFQALFNCRVCGAITESVSHCNYPATLQKGFAWLGNDMVNVISIALAAILGILGYNLFVRP